MSVPRRFLPAAALVLAAASHAAQWNRIRVGPGLDELGFPRWDIVPDAAPTAGRGTFELRVLSLNVHGLAEIFVGRKEFPERRFRELGLILKARRDAGTAPHIVALQEAFVPETDEIARASGYPHASRGPGGGALRLNSGLLLLSEFPIEEEEAVVFGQCAALDCFARKGAQSARVRVPGLPGGLVVFNTHLNAEPEPSWTGEKAQTERAAWTQTWDLREFMSKKGVFRAASIVAADLNFRQGEFGYQSFAGWLKLGGMQEALRTCLDTPGCRADPDAEAYWGKTVDHQFFVGGTLPPVSIEPRSFTKTMRQRIDGHRLTDHAGQEFSYLLSW